MKGRVESRHSSGGRQPAAFLIFTAGSRPPLEKSLIHFMRLVVSFKAGSRPPLGA
jgi:hypothetical protein